MFFSFKPLLFCDAKVKFYLNMAKFIFLNLCNRLICCLIFLYFFHLPCEYYSNSSTFGIVFCLILFLCMNIFSNIFMASMYVLSTIRAYI